MRSRILAMTVVIVFLAIVAFAVPLGFVLVQRQRDADRRELIQAAVTAASRLPHPIERTTAADISTGTSHRVSVTVYGPSGTRVVGSGPAQLDAALRGALGDEIVNERVGGDVVTAVPVVDNREVIGIVRASESSSSGTSSIIWALVLVASLGVGIIGAAAVAAVLLARRLARPLERLRADAARIGDGDFTTEPTLSGLPEIDDVAATLATTASRLGDLIEREQAFSADVSHQLRTPLAGLRLQIEGELLHPSGDGRRVLESALADVDRLEGTIGDLLALARDMEPTARQPFPLNELLAEVETRWRVVYRAAGRPLHVARPDAAVEVRTSRTAAAQIVDVLLDNAIRHASGSVDVSVRALEHAVTISVSDEGPGIPDRSELFQRRPSAASGTGIGLALAQRLATVEGGRLRVTRTTPGSTFELTLPTP